MEVERNPTDLAFLVSRWSTSSPNFFVAWREFYPSLKDVAMLTDLTLFSNFHVVDALNAEGESWSRSCTPR